MELRRAGQVAITERKLAMTSTAVKPSKLSLMAIEAAWTRKLFVPIAIGAVLWRICSQA